METILQLAARNTERAKQIVQATDIINIWKSIGAEINLVGSLKMGLMMKHRDIDFHVYTPRLTPAISFQAITQLAANPAIKRIEYKNLIDTDEHCIEWHAWYEDSDYELWQIDMIHILKGSYYDGYFRASGRTNLSGIDTRNPGNHIETKVRDSRRQRNHGNRVLSSRHSRRDKKLFRFSKLAENTSCKRNYRLETLTQ